MRFRRETGDFSIKLTFNEETGKLNDIQLPKGLSAEELLGVFVSTTTEVRPGVTRTIVQPITMVFDMGYYSAVMLNSPSSEPPEPYFYDPKTGILGEDQPAPPAGSGIALVSLTHDDAYLPMYISNASYQSTLIAPGAPVTLTVADNMSSIPQGQYSGSITETVPVDEDTTVTYGRNVSVTVPAGSIAVTIEYTVDSDTITPHHIYYDPASGNIGHAALVFGNDTGGGGSSSV